MLGYVFVFHLDCSLTTYGLAKIGTARIWEWCWLANSEVCQMEHKNRIFILTISIHNFFLYPSVT